jgi:hypothetical protein
MGEFLVLILSHWSYKGIGGLVAAKFASEVLITDGNELVMQAVRENIDKNPSRKSYTYYIVFLL